MGTTYIGTYWEDREESADVCAEVLAHLLRSLGELSPDLRLWFRRGARRASAKEPVGIDPVSLTRMLEQGVNRRDSDGVVLPELGFSFSVWNRSAAAVAVAGTLGAHSGVCGVRNGITINFPVPGADASNFYDPSTSAQIFESVVGSVSPSWAVWSSSKLWNAQDVPPGEPTVGWFTYVSKSVDADEVPAAVTVVGASGRILRIADRVEDVSIASVLDARRDLVRAGLLTTSA